MSEIEITQVARDQAKRIVREFRQEGWPAKEEELAGLLSRFRHEARAEALEENKAWAEAVTAIMARCEALEDEASDGLERSVIEHARGVWSGQKMAAKSIRRELHDLTRALRSGEREG